MPEVAATTFLPGETAMRFLTKKVASRIVAVGLLCYAAYGFANEPGDDVANRLDLSLEEAVSLAVRNNRKLIDARLDRVVERFSLRVAENEFRPHVSVGPYIERTRDATSMYAGSTGVSSKLSLRLPTGGLFKLNWSGGRRSGDASSQPRYSNVLEFTFTQPLLRGAGAGVATASLRTARLAEEVGVLALREAVIDVVSTVVGNCHDYMKAGRRVEIRAKSLERARELLAVNELLVRTGRMAERDIVETKADIAERELRLLSARNSLDAARLKLADVLDVDSRTRIRLEEALGVSMESEAAQANMAASVETARRHRPDYLQALAGVRVAEIEAKAAANERRWDLSVTMSAKLSGAGIRPAGAAGRLEDTDYGVRLDFGIPIGQAAADPGEYEHVKAVVRLKKARNDLENLRQRIDIEVSNAMREVELSRRQIELARTARELAERKTEFEKEKLRLGLSSNFRLVAFEEDLVSAQNGELDALLAHRAAMTALDRTMGTTLMRWKIEVGEADRKGVR